MFVRASRWGCVDRLIGVGVNIPYSGYIQVCVHAQFPCIECAFECVCICMSRC